MLSINISELIWTVINFFLLLLLLKRFLYTPVIRFMEERAARVQAGLQAEREAQSALEETAERLAEQKAEARRQAHEIAARAEKESEAQSAEALQAAREQARDRFQTGSKELAGQQEREESALQGEKDALAELLSRQLLS